MPPAGYQVKRLLLIQDLLVVRIDIHVLQLCTLVAIVFGKRGQNLKLLFADRRHKFDPVPKESLRCHRSTRGTFLFALSNGHQVPSRQTESSHNLGHGFVRMMTLHGQVIARAIFTVCREGDFDVTFRGLYCSAGQLDIGGDDAFNHFVAAEDLGDGLWCTALDLHAHANSVERLLHRCV